MDNNPTANNDFYGIKVSKPGIPVNQASDKQLVYKSNFSTDTYYDVTNSRILIGRMPDGSYNIAIGYPGIDVETAFS